MTPPRSRFRNTLDLGMTSKRNTEVEPQTIPRCQAEFHRSEQMTMP